MTDASNTPVTKPNQTARSHQNERKKRAVYKFHSLSESDEQKGAWYFDEIILFQVSFFEIIMASFHMSKTSQTVWEFTVSRPSQVWPIYPWTGAHAMNL